MNKLFSLIKVSLNHDMNIFKINTRKKNIFSIVILPIILTLYIMFLMGSYSYKLLEILTPLKLEFIVLTIFTISISFLTLIEGIYKSSTLLFNAKDDNLLLSLPIKKSTVFFIRIFKFYSFELLYNSMFLLPAIVIYAIFTLPNYTYYISSFVALLVLPILPIAISCIIGFLISIFSSKFKRKNIFQTIFTTLFILLVLYISYNLNGFMSNIISNASNINNVITKLYFPVGMYIKLITKFSIKNLLLYILINIIILLLTIYILGKVYFKINSGLKIIKLNKNNKYYIKSNNKLLAFIKKELNRFILTPVFFINAGFGLILFVIASILIPIKYNSIIQYYLEVYPQLDKSLINSLIPLVIFLLICFTSLMTSITSSMISLEGKSINFLKSLPIKSIDIVLYKVIAALVIMVPCLLIGDIIFFVNFHLDILNIFLLLITSFIVPTVSELIGIIINIKFPKFDATNDTEVVKQSLSSLVSVLIGMGVLGVIIFSVYKMFVNNISTNYIIIILLSTFILITIILFYILTKITDKNFKNFNI